MKIPQAEINLVHNLCKKIFLDLKEFIPPVEPDTPYTIFGNVFPNLAWLKYHPWLSIGGTPAYFTQQGDYAVVIYDVILDALYWFNAEMTSEGPIRGWHPITFDRDEVIEAI